MKWVGYRERHGADIYGVLSRNSSRFPNDSKKTSPLIQGCLINDWKRDSHKYGGMTVFGKAKP